MSKFTNRKGKIRLYDGTGSAFYLECDFDLGDFSGPMGTPKTEEILVLDRNQATSDMHYIEGGDDVVMAPIPLTFSAFIVDKTQSIYLIDWIDVMNGGLSAAINSNTIVTTAADTQRDGANNNPVFVDAGKLLCNIEYKLDGGTDRVWHYNEVWLPADQQQISEAEDGVTIGLNGQVYGTIVRDTAFTAGSSASVE